MKTAREIVDEFGSARFCDVERLVQAIDEALALARADERVKATADALAQVSRDLGPRTGAQ